MTRTRMLVEQRKHRRFKIKGDASFALDTDGTERGKIIDISKGGLSFCYVGPQCFSRQPSGPGKIFEDDKVFITGIPFDCISDCEIPTGKPDNAVMVRRCSVKFSNLTTEQLVKLEKFIWNCTVDEEIGHS